MRRGAEARSEDAAGRTKREAEREKTIFKGSEMREMVEEEDGEDAADGSSYTKVGRLWLQGVKVSSFGLSFWGNGSRIQL